MKKQTAKNRFAITPAISLLTILVSGGCNGMALDPNCTDERRPSIILSLDDETMSARKTFTDVVAVATDGSYSDTARVASISDDPHVGRPFVALAFERAGTYNVTVSADGYAPWTMDGVRVNSENACPHVTTRSITASLRPLASP